MHLSPGIGCLGTNSTKRIVNEHVERLDWFSAYVPSAKLFIVVSPTGQVQFFDLVHMLMVNISAELVHYGFSLYEQTGLFS